MVDPATKVMGLTVDLYEDLIEVPAPVRGAAHSRYSLPTNVCCEHRTEPVPPEAYGFMADINAPFEEQVFDISQ